MATIVDRATWGAAPPRRDYTGRGNSPRCVVHHTAGDWVRPEKGRPGAKWWALLATGKASIQVRRALRAWEKDRDNVIARECAAMRAMQAAHFARGYLDIGYHAVTFPSGRIYLGRPTWAVGAHTMGANSELGFSFAGNFEHDRPTPAALAAFTEWQEKHGVLSVRGHYRVPGNATACPGRYLKMALGV